MSLLEVLKGASDFLARQEIESPRLNAEHLVAHVLGAVSYTHLTLPTNREV